MPHFSDYIMEQNSEKKSALVVGLDPDIRNFPKFLQAESGSFSDIGDAIYRFNKLIIDSVHEHVAIVKPQLAYYEIYGSQGILALEQTISYAKSKKLIVINDAKRNDIGSSADAYARAFLQNGMPLCGDAVTVNPFLGSDGIMPFLEEAHKNEKGIFVLLKTSNPSSGELQDLPLNDNRPMYWTLADKLINLSKGTYGQPYSFVGAVVGATYPKTAIALREHLPKTLFLVPGYGAQGGTAADLKGYFDRNGNGALISSSRAIIYSYMHNPDWMHLQEKDVKLAVSEAVQQANRDINQARFS